MCGRTCCTLNKDVVPLACSAVTPQVPKWQEAPCGGHYEASTNVPPTAYTPVLFQGCQKTRVKTTFSEWPREIKGKLRFVVKCHCQRNTSFLNIHFCMQGMLEIKTTYIMPFFCMSLMYVYKTCRYIHRFLSVRMCTEDACDKSTHTRNTLHKGSLDREA